MVVRLIDTLLERAGASAMSRRRHSSGSTRATASGAEPPLTPRSAMPSPSPPTLAKAQVTSSLPPASQPLIVFGNGEPVDVYPHQGGDGYETIRAYLTAL
jgi:hypothetical protein